MNPNKKIVQDAILDLEGIVWEAENAEFFSIDDLPPIAEKLGKIEWQSKWTPFGVGDVLAIGWYLVPIYVILLPFAYLYSIIFQRN